MRHLTYLFILLHTSIVSSQSFEITYFESLRNDNINQQVGDPRLEALIREKLQSMDSEMSLSLNTFESNYSKKNVSPTNNNTVYKNFIKKQIISQENILDRKFLIEESIEKKDWSYSSDEKTICGLICRKAQNSEGEIAWFTTEIPIGDGPSKYYGLPGLILEVETKTKKIIAKNIKKTNGIPIQGPATGKKISREDFIKLKAKKLEELGVPDSNNDGGMKIIKL